ncbi:MAG: DoxX protein [Planctomycetia bacterium]|nr:DoxX protein [Planctomycetia bacterium]
MHAFAPLFAHEKWFLDGDLPELTLWRATEPLPLSLILAVVIVSTLAWAAFVSRDRRTLLPGPEQFGATQDSLAMFYGWVPFILGIHTAVPLLVCGVNGEWLSPNNDLEGWSKYVLGLMQTGIALALFYGGFTRLAAALLGVVWLAGGLCFGLEPMLENAHFLGLAGFFWLCGRGPWSIDRLLFPALKLGNPALAEKFLEVHRVNFTHLFGIPLSNSVFAICAGAVELLVGIWVAFGIFIRLIIVIAWFPFNLTLTHFNWLELIGHLPFYGLLAVLLVWDPKQHEQAFLNGLRGRAAQGGRHAISD